RRDLVHYLQETWAELGDRFRKLIRARRARRDSYQQERPAFATGSFSEKYPLILSEEVDTARRSWTAKDYSECRVFGLSIGNQEHRRWSDCPVALGAGGRNLLHVDDFVRPSSGDATQLNTHPTGSFRMDTHPATAAMVLYRFQCADFGECTFSRTEFGAPSVRRVSVARTPSVSAGGIGTSARASRFSVPRPSVDAVDSRGLRMR